MENSLHPYIIHNPANDASHNGNFEQDLIQNCSYHNEPHRSYYHGSSGVKANPERADANGGLIPPIHQHQQQQQQHQQYFHHGAHHHPGVPHHPGAQANFFMSTTPIVSRDSMLPKEDPMNQRALAAAAAAAAAANAVQVGVAPDQETNIGAMAALQAGASFGTMIVDTPPPPPAGGGMMMNAHAHHASINPHHPMKREYDSTTNHHRHSVTTGYPNNGHAAATDQIGAGSHDDDDDTNDDNSGSPLKRKRSRSTHRISWEERIQQLQDYKNQHGDLLIPIRYKENPSLGKFVHNTREQYKLFHKEAAPGKTKKCSLTAERIDQLEELGFVWSTERSKHQKEDWEARLEQLKEYKEKHGDCLVPHGYTEDPSFAEWVHRQRTTHAHMLKEEHPSHLVEERMKQLEDMGFHFTVHADKWMEHWHELKEYKATNGSCEVPTHCPENPKLGRWVHTQRHQRRLQLKGKKSCMTEERVALLNSLGFSWEVRHKSERPRATWEQRYEDIKQFVQDCHHFCVPGDAMPHLHAWCLQQKQRLLILDKQIQDGLLDASNNRPLNVDQVRALEAIGFTKDVNLGISSAASAANSDGAHQQHINDTGWNASTAFDNEHTEDAFDALMNDHAHSEEHLSNPDGSSDGEDMVAAPSVGPDRDCTIQASGRRHGASGDIFSPGMAMV